MNTDASGGEAVPNARVGLKIIQLELDVRLDRLGQPLRLRHPGRGNQFMGRAGIVDPAVEMHFLFRRIAARERGDAATAGVAADHDIVDAEVQDGVLYRRADRIIGRAIRRHGVGDVADLEKLAGIGGGDLSRNDAAIGAADPQQPWLLLFACEAFVKPAIALELLAKALITFDRVGDIDVDAFGVLLLRNLRPPTC